MKIDKVWLLSDETVQFGNIAFIIHTARLMGIEQSIELIQQRSKPFIRVYEQPKLSCTSNRNLFSIFLTCLLVFYRNSLRT
ncbi:Uncharacterised protein [Serratia ficaria]|nr:Uncharacterised protein [Serratia ficaria]